MDNTGLEKIQEQKNALEDIINYLHTKKENKKFFNLILENLKKAFDSISRHLLLNKLKDLGFGDNTLKWFN